MIIKLKLNKELIELIELICKRENISVPEFIQDNLELAALEYSSRFIESIRMES